MQGEPIRGQDLEDMLLVSTDGRNGCYPELAGDYGRISSEGQWMSYCTTMLYACGTRSEPRGSSLSLSLSLLGYEIPLYPFDAAVLV